jgi:hypothetical protein
VSKANGGAEFDPAQGDRDAKHVKRCRENRGSFAIFVAEGFRGRATALSEMWVSHEGRSLSGVGRAAYYSFYRNIKKPQIPGGPDIGYRDSTGELDGSLSPGVMVLSAGGESCTLVLTT